MILLENETYRFRPKSSGLMISYVEGLFKMAYDESAFCIKAMICNMPTYLSVYTTLVCKRTEPGYRIIERDILETG